MPSGEHQLRCSTKKYKKQTLTHILRHITSCNVLNSINKYSLKALNRQSHNREGQCSHLIWATLYGSIKSHEATTLLTEFVS